VNWKRVEAWVVVLIAVHSYLIGLALMFLTRWGTRFGGWGELNTLFFPRQAGAFHIVIATGYLIEYFRYRSIALLLTAKSCAVVFLFSLFVLNGEPWPVPLSGLADGLMGATVLFVHLRARQQLS